MSEYNPNKQATLGAEWLVHHSGLITLDAKSKVAGISLVQSASQTIGVVRVPITQIPVRGGLYALEVYDGEDASVSGLPTFDAARPNESVAIGSWTEDDGTTTTIHDQIDESGLHDASDYIKLPANVTTPSRGTFRVNSAGLSLTGRRILNVRLVVIGVVGPLSRLTYGLNLSGTDYQAGQLVGPTQNPVVAFKDWYFNPSTNAPWTIAQVQALDSTDEWWVEGRTGNLWTEIRVYQAYIEVWHYAENRIAVGTLNDLASGLTADAWNDVTVTTPTGGAWTKDGAGRHLYLLRRINDVGAITIPYVSSGSVGPNASGWSPTLNAATGAVSSMGTAHGRIFGLVQRTTAPADSTDSQPYSRAFIAQADGTNEQEFTPGATASYGVVRFAINPSGMPDSSSVTVRVRRRSDNVQMGGTLVLTAEQIRAFPALGDTSWRDPANDETFGPLGDDWRIVDGRLSSAAALVSGTQYFIEVDQGFTGGVIGPPYSAFFIVGLDTEGQAPTAGFGGTTDRGAETDDLDYPITIATVPTTPANFDATLVQVEVDTVCCVEDRDEIELSWTATALGADFLRYEIERSEDGGTTWALVATITDETVDEWSDQESLRDVLTSYRIRVVREDESSSDWSATATETASANGAAIVFASNYDPTLAVVYDRDPEVRYANNDADAAATAPIYGRDTQVGAQPLERIGWTVTYVVHVGIDDHPPDGDAHEAFEPLRAIAKAQLPYVAVLDHYGTRLYAQVRLTDGSHVNPFERYTAEVVAIEISDRPFAVEVTA